MDTYNPDYCTHSDIERSFTGTWGTPEIELALKHGYQVLRYFIFNFKR